MNIARLARALIAAGCLSTGMASFPVLAEDAPTPCQLVKFSSFPIEVKDGRLFVNGSINDQAVRFMIDTGSFYTFLSSKSADRIGLKYHANGDDIISLGDKQKVKVAKVDHWKLGDVKVNGTEMGVEDEDFGDGVDGLLGPDVFLHYDIEIDAANSTLTYWQPAACLDGSAYWSPDNYQSVPLKVTADSHIQIPVTVNGKTAPALLDTGASVTSLSGVLAKGLGIHRDTPGVVATSDNADAKRYEDFSSYRISSIAIGGEEMRNYPIWIIWGMANELESHRWSKLDFDPHLDSDWEAPTLMLLGMDFIIHNRIYISYQNHFLAFTPYSARDSSAQPAATATSTH